MKSVDVLYSGFPLRCFYNKKYLRIDDSYKVEDKYTYTMSKDIMELIKKKSNIEYKRSLESWTIEWIAHNRLYKLGLFKKHTKDVDIDENESLFRRICYHIISIDYIPRIYFKNKS